MRHEEYLRLKQIFENEARELPAPTKTYESYMSELVPSSNTLKTFLIKTKTKAQKHPVLVKNIEEFYSSVLKTINKNFKQLALNYQNSVSQHKKLAIICARELKRSLSKTSKTNPVLKCKRINKELNHSIKRNSREESYRMKKEEKEVELKKKKEEEEKEELRQKRKFAYLMSQTEAFTNFFVKKNVEGVEADEKVSKAVQTHMDHLKEFGESKANSKETDDKISLDNTQEGQERTVYEYQQVTQPEMLHAKLKDHQIKGLNWLVNLYNQGINGILADDMGLGKTIQSISLLAHLAEKENVWGPFLIITPSSTLHNWSSEIARFVPDFSILNYWGNVQERKDLRKKIKKSNCVITSYQVAVSDEAIISKIKWQYMILDEAQAIKSINSQRWKILLNFKSRNRLLLTGTPIQNNMQELWSLLHFIMPTLFDSLTEFSEWFSKDIENRSKVEEEQINKLHTILKPFMLRRNKNDIKDEIGSKEIINVFCEMNNRQKILYDEIINSKLDYENIIMQLKKVCNHPELFEKLDANGPFCIAAVGENGHVNHKSFYTRYITEDAKSIRSSIRLATVPFIPMRSKFAADFKPKTTKKFKSSSTEMLDNAYSFCQDSVGNHEDVEDKLGLHVKRQKLNESAKSLDTDNITTKYNLFSNDHSLSQSISHMPSWHAIQQAELAQQPQFLRIGKKSLLSRSSFFNDKSLKDYTRIKNNLMDNADENEIILDIKRRRSAVNNDMSRFKFLNLKVLNKHTSCNLDSELRLVPQSVSVPPLNSFISDSGKLSTLDKLLFKLKEEGHRVLIYFQMTKMMDLFEEYLVKKEYNYLRLDGSSKINHRKELVEEWQKNSDVFVFILSTRAGGVGINLTAADTVIFYDSDWNPTVDQQAMDRVHRLGQTKDVTVYRLITKNSVEERVMARANKKEEVQKIVIKGNVFEGSYLDQ